MWPKWNLNGPTIYIWHFRGCAHYYLCTFKSILNWQNVIEKMGKTMNTVIFSSAIHKDYPIPNCSVVCLRCSGYLRWSLQTDWLQILCEASWGGYLPVVWLLCWFSPFLSVIIDIAMSIITDKKGLKCMFQIGYCHVL